MLIPATLTHFVSLTQTLPVRINHEHSLLICLLHSQLNMQKQFHQRIAGKLVLQVSARMSCQRGHFDSLAAGFEPCAQARFPVGNLTSFAGGGGKAFLLWAIEQREVERATVCEHASRALYLYLSSAIARFSRVETHYRPRAALFKTVKLVIWKWSGDCSRRSRFTA